MQMNKKVDGKKVIIILGILIVLGIVYFLLFHKSSGNKYEQMENKMISYAKEYVQKNNISSSREVYLDVTKLGMDLDSACFITSGVFYNDNKYQANLMCQNYKSNVISTNEEISDDIKLLGDEVMVIAKGVNYYEPGYTSSSKVTVIGEVLNEEGVYSLCYQIPGINQLAMRKVVVIDNPLIRSLFPIIELVGNENVDVVLNSSYQELGVSVTDSVDGNISNQVQIIGNVNTNSVGEYILTYVVTNTRGYTNSTERTINVISDQADLKIDYILNPNNLTNGDVTINLKINGEYQKIVYPDNREGKNLDYTVKENGEYQFKIYDQYNRVLEKTIKVNNIDRTVPKGSCRATMYYNKTEIKVSISTDKKIASYEYIVDGKVVNKSQNNVYTSNKVKPSSVKVRIKDAISNENELICTLENKLTRQIVTNAKGKNCLEGYVCYIQFEYGNASKYPFCSINNNPNACGGIGSNGCSITSTSIAIAALGGKSRNGAVYTPYTVWEELYPINKNTGTCNGGCSSWSRMKDAITNAGFATSKNESSFNNSSFSTITAHLKKGYPVIVYATKGPFVSGSAHYMTLLGIREDGYVFLSDSANYSGTKKATYNGKQYYVDTWVPLSDLISGNVKEYLLVGPKGSI